MPDCQLRYNAKKQPPTQCRACGTNKILKYDNNFFKHKPYNSNFEFSNKKWKLTKNPTLKKKKKIFFFFFFFFFVGGGGGGEGVGPKDRRR